MSLPGAWAVSVLLVCGVVAGPLYILVGVIEMLVRRGFDLRRHSFSLLSNGEGGWIHIAMLVTTGLLTIAGAVGMRRALRGERGGTWGSVLIGLYGLGLIGAGVFVADPALGFPPGTLPDATTISWHGLIHFVTGGIGFLGLIAACFVFARHLAARNSADGRSTPSQPACSSSQPSSASLQDHSRVGRR